MSKTELQEEITTVLKEVGLSLPPGPYANRIQNWWFPDNEILTANKEGRLLTLDLDVGKACDLDCSFCFADTREGHYDLESATKRIEGIIDEGVDLGLKSLKIVGAGEPFIFRNLLRIIDYAHQRSVSSIAFTGGHIIGDDNYARRMFAHEGINSGAELANRLAEMNASVVLKYLTFNPELDQRLVNPQRKDFDYVVARDRGLINLVRAGLSSHEETRLGVDSLLLRENYSEAVDLFSFFNRNNIFCLMNSTLDCGNTAISKVNSSVLTKDEVQEVAQKIFQYCKDNQIPFGGLSPYLTSPVCSQLNHGMFVGYDDTVKACPGAPAIARYEPGKLAEIWQANPFRKQFAGSLETVCVSRHGKTMYHDFRERVYRALK